MSLSRLGLSLGLGGGTSATSSGGGAGGAPFVNEYSIDLDGTDAHVDTNMVAPADSTYSYTAWVKVPSGATTGIVVADFTSGGDNSKNRGVLGWRLSKWYFNMGEGSAGAWNNNTSHSASAILDNSWHFIALTIDGYDQKIYVDNALNASVTLTRTAGTLGTENLHIGSLGDYTAWDFNGKIDEVARFGYVLSLSEVQALYNSGVPTDLNSLAAGKTPTNWWRMGDSDGGTGTTITDVGSSPSNGDLENGPTFSSDVPT